jgi:hypothetical protein
MKRTAAVAKAIAPLEAVVAAKNHADPALRAAYRAWTDAQMAEFDDEDNAAWVAECHARAAVLHTALVKALAA